MRIKCSYNLLETFYDDETVIHDGTFQMEKCTTYYMLQAPSTCYKLCTSKKEQFWGSVEGGGKEQDAVGRRKRNKKSEDGRK